MHRTEMKIVAHVDQAGEKATNGDVSETIDPAKVLAALREDKLISGPDATIEVNNGEISIDGKKLPGAMAEKYGQILNLKKNVNLKINLKN
jgi:hypothetical protein